MSLLPLVLACWFALAFVAGIIIGRMIAWGEQAPPPPPSLTDREREWLWSPTWKWEDSA